jgi:sugar/nucleoside kinase (ribokinase family)
MACGSMLVVGSVALDSVETPLARRDEVLGGSASFFSTVASLLGPVRLVAVVGEDFPEEHVAFLRGRGVDVAGLQRAAGRTFRWSGRYLPDMVGRETLETQLNVFESFEPQLSESYRDSEYVLLANIHPALQLQVLEQVARPKLVACDTMNLWIDQERPALARVLRQVDILLINDEEARLLTDCSNLVTAAAQIQAMGPTRVVIKRGDAGAMLFDEKELFWAPAFPVLDIVDPTGAGDSFAGGLVSYLAYTQDLAPANLRRAMVYGSVVGSFCVEDFSLDRFRRLTRDEVLARCCAFADLVRFGEVTL